MLCSIHPFIMHAFLLSLSSGLSNKHDRTFHHCFAGWLSRRGTAWLGSLVLTSVSNGPIFLTKVNVFLRKIGHNLDLFGLHLGHFFCHHRPILPVSWNPMVGDSRCRDWPWWFLCCARTLSPQLAHSHTHRCQTCHCSP